MITMEHVFIALVVAVFSKSVVASKLPYLDRKLINNGFHRDLTTVIEIPTSLFSHKNTDCYSICKESLTNSVYVDTFQLKSISKHLGQQFVAPTLDIEKPTYEFDPSDQFDVLIYSKVHVGPDSVLINVTVPIHLRYHLPGTDYRQFYIQNPEILIRCTDNDFIGEATKREELPCTSENKTLCKWSVVKFESVNNDILVNVPVGSADHMTVVVTGTLLATFGGCLWIIVKVMNNKKKQA